MNKKTTIVFSVVVVLLVAGVAVLAFLWQTSTGDLNSAKADLLSTQDELTTTQNNFSSIQSELDGKTTQLADIQSKFPLRRFADSSELESWLAEQPDAPESTEAVLWLRHAYDLQEAAANDGFLISADYLEVSSGNYFVWCSAVTDDDSYYFWDPETDSLTYAIDITRF